MLKADGAVIVEVRLGAGFEGAFVGAKLLFSVLGPRKSVSILDFLFGAPFSPVMLIRIRVVLTFFAL
jgi:hypothetical protein